MLEILLFAALGLAVGVIFGLIPGLHPNLVALFIPVIAALGLEPASMIAFIVSVAVSNTFVDFIPSMLLGAPEAGKELVVLPAHKMLLEGNGYEAIKLAVTGGIGAVICLALFLPVIVIFIPGLYEIVKPFTHLLLIFIVFLLVNSEKSGGAKLVSLGCFGLAGIVGLLSSSLSIERSLVLFPMLSGLFGVSTLILSSKNYARIKKTGREVFVTGRQTRRAVLFGSIGGLFSGLLPGVGASEIAAMSSVDKNEKSFLITVGAVTIANTIMSMLAIWLISNPRSGVAVVMEQLVSVGMMEGILIVSVALMAAGVSAIITLKLSKNFLKKIENTDYTKLNWAVVTIILVATVFFTGFQGIVLLATCTALGVFVNLSQVRRSTLMGCLILPTILFYLPF